MKTNCEKCSRALPSDSEAYVCSYECTFCRECSSDARYVCPHCGGELLRRPRRPASPAEAPSSVPMPSATLRNWILWAASFGVWALVAVAATVSIYQFDRVRGTPMPFKSTLALEFSQVLTYAPLTPFVFALALRFPLRRRAWFRRCVLYLACGLLFSVIHVAMRGLTYSVWDTTIGGYTSSFWDAHTHAIRIRWDIFESLFLLNVVDDITGTYVPILLIAHAVSYYRGLRERELRTSQLQAQLAKAQLQALKSQLQPHFLFNTLHSISTLMLTDVAAADRMMTRLSDLLRMILEDAGTQITTLSRELEFVNCYLEIEKVRFEERLNVVLDIAPETLDALVPHLLLQPLVDNAVKHGVSRRSQGGTVRVESSVHNGELELRVSDDGAGLEKNEAPFTRGFGLRATRERIETLYGQNQSLEMQSLPEGGVAVQIHIPFQGQKHDEVAALAPADAAPAAISALAEPRTR